jgi:hypothetical protein
MSIKDWAEFILYTFLMSSAVMAVGAGVIHIIDRKMRKDDE